MVMPLIQLKHASLEVVQIDAPATAPNALAPIVFLHEGLGCVAMWRSKTGFWPQEVCQATGRAGLVYSRRGYGQSDDIPDVRGVHRLAPDYMHQHAWEVLPELLAALHIQHPVLVGHSDGATIALLYAARFETSACVAMAPHVMVEDVSIRSIEQARDAYLNTDLRAKLSKYHKHVDTAFWQWNDVWLSEAFAGFDIRDTCQSIRCPVLAIQGENDAYGSLRQIEEIQPKHADIQRVILEQCGHSPFKERPQEIIDSINHFLRTPS